MRLIRKLLVVMILGVAGVAAYAYWSDNGQALREKATGIAAETAKREAGELAGKAAGEAKEAASRIAGKAAVEARDAAGKLGGTVSDGALTAKIKSKMALDDHVKARAINVHPALGVARGVHRARHRRHHPGRRQPGSLQARVAARPEPRTDVPGESRCEDGYGFARSNLISASRARSGGNGTGPLGISAAWRRNAITSSASAGVTGCGSAGGMARTRSSSCRRSLPCHASRNCGPASAGARSRPSSSSPWQVEHRAK